MNIYDYFNQSLKLNPDRDALFVNETSYSYRELDQQVGKISRVLNTTSSIRVGIFAARSLSSYAGIMASLKSGMAYVPLNPKFPSSRNSQIQSIAELNTFVVDEKSVSSIQELMKQKAGRCTIIFPEMNHNSIPENLHKGHNVYAKEQLTDYSGTVVELDSSSIAYILFTSGSTGVPKGVPVSHGNVTSYVEYQRDRYNFNPNDRFSQTFDLTFDPSVHDLFMCWDTGASLYCIPESELMAPAKFITNHKLTIWYSVPSIAQFMHRFKMLKPGRFPNIRYALFSGEALPKNIAVAWQAAAPNADLENLYGPTEATINITHYRLPKDVKDIDSVNGIVSIGKAFETQNYCLIDDKYEVIDSEGELCVSGSLVTEGYLNNPEKTAEQYIRIEGLEGVWYRTGDLVREQKGLLYYLTRIDFQVKVRGYRVELDEVSLAVSQVTGASVVCSLPWPVKDGVADSIYTFVNSEHEHQKELILEHLADKLPNYMIPKELIFVDDIPLNANGKIDRKELQKMLPEN